jgi:hypothetical protein
MKLHESLYLLSKHDEIYEKFVEFNDDWEYVVKLTKPKSL